MKTQRKPVSDKRREEETIRTLLRGSVQQIEASEGMKRRIDDRIAAELGKEKSRMKRISMKKMCAGIAVACLLAGMACIAGSSRKYMSGSSSADPDYTSFQDMEKAESAAGYEVKAVERFGNGFLFHSITMMDGALHNDRGEKEETQKEIRIDYRKEQEGISLFTRRLYEYERIQLENGEKISDAVYDQTLAVGDVEVGFCRIMNKFVPPDYELTKEDEENMENPNFNLAYGASEVTLNTGYSVSWIQDGISYHLYGVDLSLDGDEMLEMAREIIESGQEQSDEGAPEDTAPGESAAGSVQDESLSESAPDESTSGSANGDTLTEDKLTGDTLTCDVVSVNEQNHSVTARKIYVEENPDGSQTAVSYVGDGGDQAENIRVYFRDNVRYTLQMIENGGADVTTKEADFSDIRRGDMLSLKGKAAISEASGYEFLASEAVISRVIL